MKTPVVIEKDARIKISGTQPAEMIGALNAFAFSTFPLHLKEFRSVLSDQFNSLFFIALPNTFSDLVIMSQVIEVISSN